MWSSVRYALIECIFSRLLRAVLARIRLTTGERDVPRSEIEVPETSSKLEE
jgi:hypothetical protein